jgi:hypothetical protein
MQKGALDRSSGKNYLQVDSEQGMIYVDGNTAIASSFSAYLVATSISGINEGFY